MKRLAHFLFILFVVVACQPATASVQLEQPTASPYPDTPSPPKINASLVEAPSLLYLDMLNELDGWGLTNSGIVRTNDGGITWYDVTPPGLTVEGESLDAVFLDADHAWVQVPDMNNYPDAGTLYRTADGGLTWTFNAVQFSGGHMTFLNENDGWMMADLGAGAGSMAVSVFVTKDGGVTWSQMFINDPNHPAATETLPLGGIKGGLVPINLRTAWIGGVTYSPATVYLYRTDDSGITWSQVNLELPADAGSSEAAVAEMKFVNANDGFIALRITGESYRTAFYVTHDSGDTWSLLPTILPGTGTTDFVSAQEIVFYNGQQFYVSRDAGGTWSITESSVVFGDFFASMDFVGASIGWVITSDASSHRSLYKTADGGARWTTLIP
jgi:photosystem II stability/assembly factor-like uncharacterized protein